MTPSESPAYIARCQKCHRVLCAMMDSLPEKHKAKEIASWVRDGLSVERMPNEDVRTAQWGHDADCPDAPKPPKQKAKKPEPKAGLFT